MATTTFDSLAYFERLKAAGVPEEQAKVQAAALREIIDEKLVTKDYLDMKMRELEYQLVIKLGVMLAASIAVVATLVKIL